MTFKIVNNSNPGDADHYGGNDIDDIATYLNNTIIGKTYTLYRSGVNVKARNNITGIIDYSGDATDDASPTIKNAINNIVNLGSGLDASFGGGIDILHGIYKCKTEITVDIDTALRHGVSIVGEGPGTFLDFIPTGALTNGIKLRMSKPELRNMRIRGNSNVVNLIGVYPNDAGEDRADSGTLDNLLLEGPNGNGEFHTTESYTPIAGQKGIGMYAPSGGGALYYWTINNCKFISLDNGILTSGLNCTSVQASNVISHSCTDFWRVTSASTSHNLDNFWISGHTYGVSGVHLNTGTGIFNVSNGWAEISIAATTCALVLIDSGADSSNVQVWNAKNLQADGTNWFTVKDNATGGSFRPENYMALNQLLFKYDSSTRMTITAPIMALDTDKLYFHSQSGNNDIVIRIPNDVTGTKYLSLPTLTADDTVSVLNKSQTFGEGKNITLGTTTGTKLGTGTTQKLGFYNATPVIQRTGVADVNTSTIDNTYGQEENDVITSLRTKLNAVLQVLEDLGLTAVA